jgi:hypothetical protein
MSSECTDERILVESLARYVDDDVDDEDEDDDAVGKLGGD